VPRGMTGFGRGTGSHPEGTVTVEVKSVNNRFLKVSLRLPDGFQEYESEFEGQARAALARGSVYVNVSLDRGRPEHSFALNEEAIRLWWTRLRALAREAGTKEPELGELLAMQGAVLEQSDRTQADESLAGTVKEALAQALKGVVEMRAREGEALARDLEARVRNVAKLAKRVEKRAPQVVQEYREKLKARIDKLLGDTGTEIDDVTLAREVALMADRCDVTEETTRMEHHCTQFLKVMGADGESGRRLDFVAQEMLREANTVASKASDAELAQAAVEMKSEIEKVKEQVQNLE